MISYSIITYPLDWVSWYTPTTTPSYTPRCISPGIGVGVGYTEIPSLDYMSGQILCKKLIISLTNITYLLKQHLQKIIEITTIPRSLKSL